MRMGKATATVIRRRAVSLAGRKPPQPKVGTRPYTFRCPTNVYAYIVRESEEHSRTQTDVIVRAVEIDRALAMKLGDQVPRIENFAARHGLSYGDELAEVIAQLVRKGLECWESEHKSKK